MGQILPQIDRDETDRADDRQNNKNMIIFRIVNPHIFCECVCFKS